MYKRYIEYAGNYVLQKLTMENPIRFSRFMDGTKECWDRISTIEKDHDFQDGYFLPAIDCAVSQMERQGFIRTKRNLPEELCDGNQDYEIFLTHKKLGQTPSFHDEDM